MDFKILHSYDPLWGSAFPPKRLTVELRRAPEFSFFPSFIHDEVELFKTVWYILLYLACGPLAELIV